MVVAVDMTTNTVTITTARMVMGTRHPMVACLWMWVMNFVIWNLFRSRKATAFNCMLCAFIQEKCR